MLSFRFRECLQALKTAPAKVLLQYHHPNTTLVQFGLRYKPWFSGIRHEIPYDDRGLQN